MADKALIDSLLGRWRLVGAWAVAPNGTDVVPAYGDAPPDGMIRYDADGRMMAMITSGNRALIDGDRQSAPPEQRAAAFADCLGYAGRWVIEGERITHHVELATVPNWVGTDLVRFISWQGDQLRLRTAPQMHKGELAVIDLLWQKMDAA